MAKKLVWNLIISLTVLGISLSYSQVDAAICTYDAATCLCKNEDGETIIDLNDLAQTPLTAKLDENVTYTFAGCKNTNNCNGHMTSLCVWNKTAKGLYTDLGDSSQINLTPSDTHLSQYDLIYKSSNATISLLCSPDLKKPLIIAAPQISTKSPHNLVLFSSHGCRVPEIHPMSTGSRLLIMFFVFVLLYFSLGATILYFIRGARGLEMIPNIDFWRGLPSLVSDGVKFLLNGCTLPTADSYDRI